MKEKQGHTRAIILLDVRPARTSDGNRLSCAALHKLLSAYLGIHAECENIEGDDNGHADAVRLNLASCRAAAAGGQAHRELMDVIVGLVSASSVATEKRAGGRIVSFVKLPLDEVAALRRRATAVLSGLGTFPDDEGCITVRGPGAIFALEALLTARVVTMRPGEVRKAFVLDGEGKVIDTVAVRVDESRGDEKGHAEPAATVYCHNAARVETWLRMAREGHAVLDREDPEAKAPGEYAVEAADGDETLAAPEMGLQSAGAGALVDITKPFFVGQRAIEGQFEAKGLRAWAPPHIERPKPLPRTLLGEAHEKLGVAQWGAFGSATMPIQYAAGPNAIPAEHYATRCGAALYDVSHMLPIIVRGRDARAFLEMCLVNSVYGLAPGRCQYTALCRPDGAPQDDLYLNFLEHNDATGEDVLLVVGNSGHESDYYLLKALAAGDARIDAEMPGKRFEGEVRFVSRLEGARGKGRWDDPLYSVALQGPKSREIILAAVSEKDRKRVGAMEFNDLLTRVRPASGAGELVVTRTGYAGEPMGFEIYTTAGHLVELWEGLLALGATPAGLGARDSTRQEAGLPLFGHEIDGALRIPLSGGRMPRLVRFEKAFFVGRRGALDAERKRTKRVFLLSAEGPRKVSEGWPVYTPAGEFLGHVTSTSTVRPGRTDAAQAYLEEDKVKVGDKVVVTSPSRVPNEGQAPEGRVFAVSTWDKARDYKCEG